MEMVAGTKEDAPCREVMEGAKEDEGVVLPGFRFHPTDQELIEFYLRRKVQNKPIRIDIIKQIDIYKYEPWDLPRVSNVNGDKEWYFFCQRGRKYRNSVRPNRVTGSGFWKATGIDRPVYSTAGDGSNCVGLKKSLVYYRGSAGKGTKTDWMMHEFRLPAGKTYDGVNGGIIQDSETWTVCRILKRSIPHKKAMTNRQAPCDSNARTSSAESKRSDITYLEDSESKHSVITHFEDANPNISVINYVQGKNEPCAAGQYWNPSAESPISVTTYPSPPGSIPSEFALTEWSWDELGRMVEFAADPSFGLDQYCRYTPS